VDLPASSIILFSLYGHLSFDGRYVYVDGILDLGSRREGENFIWDTEVVFAVPVVSTVRVVDSSGRPLAGFVVRAMAGNYSLVNSTGADGVASFWGWHPTSSTYMTEACGWCGMAMPPRSMPLSPCAYPTPSLP